MLSPLRERGSVRYIEKKPASLDRTTSVSKRSPTNAICEAETSLKCFIISIAPSGF